MMKHYTMQIWALLFCAKNNTNLGIGRLHYLRVLGGREARSRAAPDDIPGLPHKGVLHLLGTQDVVRGDAGLARVDTLRPDEALRCLGHVCGAGGTRMRLFLHSHMSQFSIKII